MYIDSVLLNLQLQRQLARRTIEFERDKNLEFLRRFEIVSFDFSLWFTFDYFVNLVLSVFSKLFPIISAMHNFIMYTQNTHEQRSIILCFPIVTTFNHSMEQLWCNYMRHTCICSFFPFSFLIFEFKKT